MNALTVGEKTELSRLEKVVGEGLANFIAVGNALSKIRDQKLYRATHGTFEEYCRQRFSISKTHGNRLIAAAEVSRNLAPVGVISNERQARVLGSLPPEVQRHIWDRATEEVGGEPTAPQLKTVLANAVKEAEAKAQQVIQARPAAPQKTLADRKAKIAVLLEHIRREHAVFREAHQGDELLQPYRQWMRRGKFKAG